MYRSWLAHVHEDSHLGSEPGCRLQSQVLLLIDLLWQLVVSIAEVGHRIRVDQVAEPDGSVFLAHLRADSVSFERDQLLESKVSEIQCNPPSCSGIQALGSWRAPVGIALSWKSVGAIGVPGRGPKARICTGYQVKP